MDTENCLREFEKLAQRLGIEIRKSENVPSGFCVIKGAKVLFIDSSIDKSGQTQIFIDSFKKLDLDGVFVIPALRQLLGMEDNPD